MDLAADREYPVLALWRERYWQPLSAAERRRALDESKRIYADYGDAAAKRGL